MLPPNEKSASVHYENRLDAQEEARQTEERRLEALEEERLEHLSNGLALAQQAKARFEEQLREAREKKSYAKLRAVERALQEAKMLMKDVERSGAFQLDRTRARIQQALDDVSSTLHWYRESQKTG